MITPATYARMLFRIHIAAWAVGILAFLASLQFDNISIALWVLPPCGVVALLSGLIVLPASLTYAKRAASERNVSACVFNLLVFLLAAMVLTVALTPNIFGRWRH